MADAWYVMHSHPRKEEAVYRELLARNYEAFYPSLRVKPVNPRSRKTQPYFPGYLFVYTDLNRTGSAVFQWLPFATGLVSFGGQPATVPEALVHRIGAHVDEINRSGGEELANLQAGDKVHIEAGPFEGYEGIFDTRLAGTDRVRVFLKMLSDRYLELQVMEQQIRKVRKG